MSRIAVVTSNPPFAEGGHLVIARAVIQALREAGHEAALVTTPQNRFGRQAAAYAANWLTDVGVDAFGRRIDQVISFRFPSYAVRHERHVCWLNHTMREYYDLWPRLIAGLGSKGRLKERVRRTLIHASDRYLLSHNVTKLLAQSRTIQGRLAALRGVRSTVLYPPPPQRAYRCDEYGDYLFAVSRLAPLKRFDLLLKALAEPAAARVRCVIAGEGEEEGRIRTMVRELGLDSRVRMIGGVDAAQLVEQLARCRAVCFIPYDEDYGFVTVEAFAARKPVVTCTDSGGPTELVADGKTGVVSAPEPRALAAAIARVMDDAATAERMGAAGAEVAATLTWERTVPQLLLA
ncbi:MAG TPA: glycosyltransferase family 4 protein [Vicinamibacterales bacterium]|nr:glycosyltransferase family 4 protein [Vicinamibacterales bacterium]